jgi:hypothetical protein
MLPSFPQHYLLDCRSSYSELNCNGLLGDSSFSVKPSYLSNVFLCELGLRPIFTFAQSPFRHRIMDIVSVRTGKKMYRVATKRMVTLVAYVKRRQDAVGEIIGETMRRLKSSLFTKPNVSVSLFISPSFPRPAFIESSNLDFSPEHLFIIAVSLMEGLSDFISPFWGSEAIFVSHESIRLSRLICATLLGRQAAGASSFSLNAV